MAKVWGNTPAERWAQRCNYSDVVGNLLNSQKYRKKSEPKPGIKVRVIEIYAEKGKLEAWQFLQKYNNEYFDGNGFSLEMLEQWISEYENRIVQKAGKDDEYDR